MSKLLKIDEEIGFGKYSYYTTRVVIMLNIFYITWAINNKIAFLDKDAFNFYLRVKKDGLPKSEKVDVLELMKTDSFIRLWNSYYNQKRKKVK